MDYVDNCVECGQLAELSCVGCQAPLCSWCAEERPEEEGYSYCWSCLEGPSRAASSGSPAGQAGTAPPARTP